MKPRLFLALCLAISAAQLHAADTDTAATAVNALGIDLLAKTGKANENALLSPYSIQSALAMTYAGAAGKTREEMASALHFPKDGAELNKSFAMLEKELAGIEKSSRKEVAASKDGGPSEPVTLSVANRLYAQEGYDFRKAFLSAVKEYYGAPVEQVNFAESAGSVRKLINAWVEEQTRKRIWNLIPDGGLDASSRLVLVNAIYLKAAWEHEFEFATGPARFHVNGGGAQDVPTMSNESDYGYARQDGYAAVALPYVGSDLQFLVLLPDHANGLSALEAKLTPALLAGCAKLEPGLVKLWLPNFKLEPPLMELSEELKALGMKTAFNDPGGSANFDGMAPRKPDDYLAISKVFHKTFLSLDENGTEAAAATAAVITVEGMPEPPAHPPKVHEVHVDHPFIFAIQDRKSGACLFIGRVTDPR